MILFLEMVLVIGNLRPLTKESKVLSSCHSMYLKMSNLLQTDIVSTVIFQFCWLCLVFELVMLQYCFFQQFIDLNGNFVSSIS